MKCKLFMQNSNAENNKFDVDNDYYSETSYIEALNKEYNSYSNAIDTYMSDNSFLSHSNVQGDTFNLFGNKTSTKEEKVVYCGCECEAFNENGEEETIDSLISYVMTDDIVVMLLKFDFKKMDEDFESEFKMWVDGHNQINLQPHVSEEWKYANEPKRDVKLSFKNLKNDDVYLELNGCKLLEPNGENCFFIICERITFSKVL